MKIVFFNKVLFEGTKKDCETFRKNLIKTLLQLDDELQDTYPMKKTDTYQTYYESLKILNPFVYETLSCLKKIVGDYFIEFQFHHMSLEGISIRVYTDLETKKTKVYTLGFIYNTIVLELNKQTIWKIEE